VRITATVAEQLRLLHENPEDGRDLMEGLGRLGRDVALAVPSSLAVTILLDRQGSEVCISALTEPAAVLASLAVRLPGGVHDHLLILRAGAPGAYLLLAEDLRALLGPDHPSAVLDGHLSWPPLSGGSLATALADLRSINQAIGVLTDRGFPPSDARRELQRRATAGNRTVAAVSRQLLFSLRPDPR